MSARIWTHSTRARGMQFGRATVRPGICAAWALTACLTLGMAGGSQAAILRVDQAATGETGGTGGNGGTGLEDGQTWATAFHSVAAALDVATAGDEVWVARGRYLGAVALKSDVRLLGGFAAVETAREQRDPVANQTILDGGGSAGSVTSVVTARSVSDKTVLDGFVVEGGLADGLYSVSSALQVVGCRFQHNGDDGIDVDYGAPTLANCSISQNADDGIDSDGSAAIITDCTVFRNGDDGMQLNGSAALVTGNTIYENTDDGINCDSDTPHIIGNTISDNGDDGIDANFSGVEIRGNLITDNGGDGIYCFTASPVISRNEIRDNGDDGVDCYISEATLTSNLIAGNGSASGNNGIECYLSRPKVTNNTLVQNADHGIVLLNSALTAVNNIIAHHQHAITALDAGSSATLRNNGVYNPQGTTYVGLPDPTGSDGNLNTDPLFVDQAGGDYHLSATSPCLDAGDDTVLVDGDLDLDGEPRRAGAHVDIGADERAGAVVFVWADVATALRVAAGLSAWDADTARLDVEPQTGAITLADAERLARKVAGAEDNP